MKPFNLPVLLSDCISFLSHMSLSINSPLSLSPLQTTVLPLVIVEMMVVIVACMLLVGEGVLEGMKGNGARVAVTMSDVSTVNSIDSSERASRLALLSAIMLLLVVVVEVTVAGAVMGRDDGMRGGGSRMKKLAALLIVRW